jgi:hypothetical protein
MSADTVRYECWYAEPSTAPLVVVMGCDSTGLWFEAARFTDSSLASCAQQVSEWMARGALRAPSPTGATW